MKTLRKFMRSTKLNKNTKLSLSALSLATILGTAFYPTAANAVGIERADNGAIESNGNTHTIYASEVRGSVGLNRFKKFDLETNNIANMYFHAKNGGAEANNLLNFVNGKININGTVNAIQNNKIGGNLYFLSKEGLVVGKTGVINAGTFNAFTKNKTYTSNDALYRDFYDIVNMKEDLDRMNDEGRIEVYGKINTVDGIRLKAGSVIIGGTQDKGFAALKSGVVNFADVVNIKAGSTTVLSGLKGEQLRATRANNGSIVLGANYDGNEGFKNGAIQLRAYADTRNAFDKDYNPAATSITGSNVVKAEVQVNEGSSISAYSNVDISAETSYGKGLSGLFGTDIASANIMDLLGKSAKAESIITVNGNVKAGVDAIAGGKGSVNMNAKTNNIFISGAKTNASKDLMRAGSKKLLDWLFGSSSVTGMGDIIYSDIQSHATINVGEKADIQALNDINLQTSSKIKASAGAKHQVEDYYLSEYEKKDEDSWKEFIAKYSGQAGIAVNNTTNVSKINVAGKLTAGEVNGKKGAGNVKLNATSDTLQLTNVKVSQKKADKDKPPIGNGVRIGFAYSEMQNTTDVTVSGEVKANNGKITIDSSGASSITTSVSANSGDGGTMATTAIDINEITTNSSVNLTGKLSADKGMDISSTNETDICTSSEIAAKWNSEEAEAVYGEGSSGDYAGLANLFDGIARDDKGKVMGQYSKMLAAGIALNWHDVDVASTINVGPGAELNVPKNATDSKGKPAELNISATSSITDMNLQASGSATKGEKAEDGNTKLISGAVLVANVNNTATINIAGNEGDKKAPFISAPVVNINGEATNDWDRVNSMWDFVNTQWAMAVSDLKDNVDLLLLLNNAKDKILAYQRDNSEANFHAMMGAFSDLQKIPTMATYKTLTKLNKKILDDTISALFDFLCLSNYTNTFVSSSATNDGKEQAKFALSGAVAVNNFSNKANIIVGRGAQIEATNGDVDISTKTSQNLIHAAGALYEVDLKEKISTSEQDTAFIKFLHERLPSISAFPAMWAGNEAKNLIGGNVIVTNNNNQALTVIAAGANISGSNVSIGADNKLVNTNIVLAGGTAGSLGITGMGSYDGGSSDSIVSVDDEAIITADEELAIDAKNNNILTSIVGNLSSAGNLGIGASLGIVNYDINTISAVANNDKNALSEKNKLAELLRKKLSDKQQGYLGTASSGERGSLSAGDKIAITASDTGVINTLTVAGITAGNGDDSDKQGQGNAGSGGVLEKLNVAIAGSVSVNTINGTTFAGIDGSNVDGNGSADVSVNASEDKYIGAYSGAAAVKTMGTSGKEKSATTLSGSVGVNKGSQSVTSSLKNTKITDVNSVDNRAVKKGTNVAVGLAYGQTAVSSGKLGVQVVGSGSGISMNNTVTAEMDNVEISAKKAVKNIAQSKDIQVAGGVSASYARNAKVGVGASVAYLEANNTLNAKINKATITSNSLENLAVSKTTQVGGAVTAGVMTGDGIKVGVNGAVVINTLTNTNEASITGSNIKTKDLRVRAYDGNLVEIDASGEDVEDTSDNTWLKKLKDQGYNVDAVESVAGGGSAKAEGSGNKIISAAVGIGLSPTAMVEGLNISAGVAVGVNKINNNFTAKIDNSSINASQVAIEGKSNASLLNIGAVATINSGQSTNVGGGGNIAVNNIQNNITASLSDTNDFHANALTVRALDEKIIRNYAGTLNFAGGAQNNATLGVSVGVNNLSGNTIASVTNSRLNLTNAALIDAQSRNKIDNVIITAGITMSGEGLALSGAGTVAANNISGNTKASMSESDVQSSGDVTINADDETNVKSIVGNGVVSLTGGAAAGAIGVGADKISYTRSTTAELLGNATNKNTINARNLNVKANSAQTIESNAVGVGLAISSTGAGSVNGAVSTEKNVATTTATVANIKGALSNIDVDAQHSNHLKRFNLGAAASGSYVSGSLGFSVGVLNDNSETRAAFNNNNIITTGDISINAANDNNLTSNVNTAAIAISLGGAIGANFVVDDFTSKVSVVADNNQIGDADHVANSFKATASNTMHENSQQGVGSGALVAGGVGVGIFTTNTSVTNSMKNNTIYAHNITATADENRNFENNILNAGIGVGAITISALLNNVGAALDDNISYVVKQDDSTGKKENATADISAILDNLDKSMVEQDSYLTDKGLQGALSEAGLSEKDVKNKMSISRGHATTSSEGVQVISTNNKLYSDGKVNLAAHATTNMNEQNNQGSFGGAAINIAVSKTKVNNKVGVTVDGTTIDAISKTEGDKTSISARPDITISSTVDGEIKNTTLQGSATGVSINTVYTGSWLNNENKVTVKDAALVGRNLAINAQDALHNIVTTKGYTYGGVAGGALYATAQSKGKNLIDITGSNLYAGMSADNSIFDDSGALTIKAEKRNKVKATVTAGAVAAVSAKGMVATAIDGEENATDETSSVSNVLISGSNLKAGKAITATASRLLDVESKINSLSVGIAINANGAIAHAYATGAANMLSRDGNSYVSGDKLTLEALVDKQADSDHSISADMTANNGGAVGVSVNEAMTVYNVLANTQANAALYKAKDMTIKANHNVDVFNKAEGLEVGVGIASGTMAAHVTTNAKTHIDAKGAKYDDKDEKQSSDLGDVDISANTLVKENIYAKGDGGGLLDISPVAAKIVNKLTTDTVTNISGTWDLSGDFTADALNQDDITQTVKSLKVGVIGGYGGVQNYDVTQHNAKVNVGSGSAPATIITTDGVQLYQAGNIVKHHADTESSGGGLLKGSGGDLATKYDGQATKFTSSVNFDNAQLTTLGQESEEQGYTTDATEASSIKAQSFTEADLKYDNKLNGVGILYSGVWNKSDHDITYDNSVNVKGKSKMTTMDRKQDITLAAYDKSTVKFNTIASSGGFAASAYGRTYASFARNAKINIEKDSILDSAYNTYINAGGDLNGINSSLKYTVNSEAYNHSLIPAGTSGKIENNMVQNNQANIAGDITSVHNVYLNATGGSDTVKQTSKYYTIYTSDKTDEEETIVTPGDIDKNQNTNNYVNVTGKVTAGTHNGLEIDISGSIEVTKPEYNEDGSIKTKGSVDYKGIKIDIKKGSDWFTADSIKEGEVEVKNALLESYVKLQNSMAGYDSSSAEYKALERELATLLSEMKTNGFVVESTEGGKTYAVILESRYMPSIEVPDIYVSGGNIHITADKLQGNGTLTAKGVNDLKITNRSDTNMVINDVVIEEAGGRVTFNGQTADDKHKYGFEGTINADAKVGTVPTITISSTGNAGDAVKDYTNADLTILGKLQNIEGKILIENEHRNINISGDSAISAQQIEIKATQGSVTQNSNGFFSIGSDPISRYQFSKSIADKIQKYVAELIKNNQQSTFKADTYKEYCQYLLDHAKEIGLTLSERADIKAALDNYTKLSTGEVANGIVAGNNIYINARNLNIDGLVQSGYDKYNVEYTEGMQSRINELDRKYSSIANKDALTNSDVLGNPEFLINYKDGKAAGGATYDSNGKKYTYEIKLYYNPATKEIISEKIETNGGKIYLTGAISSTGNGRLLAMNGTADVGIDLSKATGANERDLNVSSIKINDVAGLISIRDTLSNKQTTYVDKGNQVERTTYDIDQKGNISNPKTELVDKNGLVYSPKAGTTLSWTGGITGAQTVTTKHYEKSFIAWGLIKYGTTQDFIDKVSGDSGHISSTTTTTADGSALNNGVYIGNKGNTGFSVDGKRYDTSKYYSGVSYNKEYDGFWGKVFGYGTAYYTWREFEGSSTSSTYTISADKNIGVGFMDGGKGNISIKNAGNLNVAGWLQNASKTTTSDNVTKITGVGAINLTSTNGDIYALDGARLATDNLAANANGSLFLYGHRAIGDDAKVSLGAQTGHINFGSEKGNLEMSGAGAANGMYWLDAAGDVTTAKNANGSYTDAKIIGGRVDITSTGNVDVRVDTGTDMSSGFINDGLSIDAQGDITVYHNENNKDLLVGEIVSHNGDVTMETNNSFVDAINDNTLSDADERIKHWQEMGIISTGDDAGSKAKSAQEQKEAALADANAKLGFLGKTEAKVTEYHNAAADLKEAVESYRSALKKAQTDEARAAALEAYNSAKATYFNSLSQKYSTDEQNAIANYAEVNFSNDYGWSANQLLYAIQSDVINSTPGQKVLGDTANITGHNITLKAGKGIGVDAPAETIKKGQLNELENMKKLSRAKSGDLTWHEDGSVTISRQQPLLINVVDKEISKPDGTKTIEKGSVNFDAQDNVYIAGIKDTQLNINGSIKTTGDIRLMADKGITTSDKAVLSGKNLLLYGGAGNVGSLDNMINISKITGSLNANTDRDHGVYIKKTADTDGEQTKLTIEGITTGDLVLESETGMDWSNEEGKTQGYIDAKTISLTATNDSDIGSADGALRILNNDAVLNASGNNIYLQGVNEAGRVGSLTAENLFVDDKLVFNSEGNIKLAERINADGSVRLGRIAKRNVQLNNGHISYSTAKDVTLNSTGGAIIQSRYHQILADKLTATAQGDVLLEGGVNTAVKHYNELQDVTLGSASGKIVLANGGSKYLDIAIAKVGENGLAQSIDLHNYEYGDANEMNVKGDVQAKGDITVTQDETGDLKTEGDITSKEGNIHLEAAKDLVTGWKSITAEKGNITIAAIGDLYNYSMLIAPNGYVAAIANGTIHDYRGHIEAGGVSYISEDGIDFNNDNKGKFIIGNRSFALISTKGSVNIWNDIDLNVKGDVWLQGHNNVTVAREGNGTLGNIVSENGDITLVADTGFVDNIGSITANKGKVTLKAVGSSIDERNGKTVLGTVTNDGSITAKSISLEAAGDIRTDLWTHARQKSTLSAMGSGEDDKLEIISRHGSVTLTNDTTLLANNDIVIQAEKNVTNNMQRHDNAGGLYTEKGDIFITTNTGDIINNNDLITGTGSIVLNSLAGTIDNNGSIDAAKAASLIAYKDLNISKDENTAKVEIIARGEGGLTFTSEAGSVSFGDGVIVASNDSINITAEKDIINNNKTARTHDTTSWTGLVAANNINMTANKGKIYNNASLWAAAGNIKMKAISDAIENTGMLTAGNDIIMQAAKSITNGSMDASQTISADLIAGGKVTMLAENDSITSKGNITASKEVSLRAKKDVISVGDVTAKGDLTMIAEEGGLSSEGNLTAGKDATDEAALYLFAKEDVISKGNIESKTGNVSLSSETANVLSTGSITGKDVSLSADQSIITDSLTSTDKLAGRNISLRADNGEIINHNSIEAEDDITLTAATDVESKGELTAHKGSIDIEAMNGRLTNAGNLQAAQNITLNAALALTNDATSLTAGNNISLRADNGSLTNSASATATNGYINFWAEDAVINGNDGSDGHANLTAGKFVSLTSDTNTVTNYGDIDAQAGDITVNGFTGVKSTGALTADEDIVLTSDLGALTNHGDLISTKGDITLDAWNNVEVVASLIKAENGSVDINSDAGSIELNKDATAGIIRAQDVSLTAAEDITNNSDITALGKHYTTQIEEWDAEQGKRVKKDKTVSISGAVNIFAGGQLTNKGSITSQLDSTAADYVLAGDVTLDAGTGLVNDGALTAEVSDINLITVGGELTNNGEITATKGNANLNAGVGALANNAKITAGQDIYMKSLSTITNSGKLDAGWDVTLDAVGKLTNSKAVKARGNITFDTTDVIENTGRLTAKGNISLDGFQGVTNKNKLTSRNGGVTLISENKDILNKSNISAKEDVKLTAGGALTNSGRIASSAGGIELTAETDKLNNSGALSAQGDVLLTANKGNLVNAKTGVINSNKGNVLLYAATTLGNKAAIAADGIAALVAGGDVTNKGVLASRAKDIYMLALAGDLTNTANASAVNGDINIRGNNITQRGALAAGSTAGGSTALGNVSISGTGTVKNSGAISATDDISMQGKELTNKAALNAGNDASLSASENLTNKAAIKAGYDVIFNAGKTIKNKATTEAGDDLLFTAGENITNAGTVKAADKLIFIAGKDITNSSTADISTKGGVQFIANDNISNKSNITAESIKMDAGTDITNEGNILKAQEDITLTAEGDVKNNASITSDNGNITVSGNKIEQNKIVEAKAGSITMNAKDTLTASGGIYGLFGVEMTANNKVTITGGKIKAGFEVKDEHRQKIFEYGDVDIESLNDEIVYDGTITGVNVTLGAAKDITINGDGTRKITATGTLDEDAALTIISTGGSVTLEKNGSLDAKNNLTIVANKNLINNAPGDLTAGKDISLISIEGDIDNNGNIKAEHGNVLLYAAAGGVDNDADITAKNISLDAYKDLSVDFFDNHKLTATGTEAGDKLELISRNGDVLIWQNTNFEAGRDIIITAKKDVWNGMSTGSQEGHDLVAKNGSITIMAEDGSFYNDADIKAKENIGIYAGDKIDSEGTINAYGTGENEGNIFLQANNDIRQAEGPVLGTNNVVLASLVGSVTLNDNVSSVNGSVAVVANGDINMTAKSIHDALLEISAKQGAYLISNNGSINADRVKADEITYAANSDTHQDKSGNEVKSEIHVKQTYVGSVLDITGNNAYLHDTAQPGSGIYDPDDCFIEHGIWQTGDKDTLYLKLSTAKNAAGQYVPAENMVLNFHKLNKRLDIDKLWVKNIDLKVPVDELFIHKLSVEQRADISTNKMHSTIYGQPPQRTDADTIFWQHYAQRNPGLNEELWSSWNDANDNSWMNLFFYGDGVRQTSNNSVLLHKRDYRYVYNQRYSAEDWLLYRTLFDESGHRGDLTLIPLYERYDLLDYADAENSTNAAELKVE